MDPLKYTPIPHQNAPEATSKVGVDQSLLVNASEIDSCSNDIFASFDFALDSSAEIASENVNLDAAIVKNEAAINLEDSGKASKVVGETAENSAQIQLKDVFIATVDAHGKDAFEAVASATSDRAQAAQGKSALVVVRGNEWGMSPEYAAFRGYKDGQVISWNGQQITVRYLNPSEIKSLSSVVTTFISQNTQTDKRTEVKDRTEERLDHANEKGSVKLHHDYKVLGKSSKRKRDEVRDDDSSRRVSDTSKRADLKVIERGKEQVAIDQEHSMRQLERITKKQLKIIATDQQKYDISNQGHLLDLLKQDHQMQPIPRTLFNTLRNQS